FEVSLSSFLPYLKVSSRDLHVAVVDRAGGRVVLASDQALPASDPPGAFPAFPVGSALRSVAMRPAMVDLADRSVAANSVARAPGNANVWVLMEWSTARASTLPPWGGALVALLGLGLIGLFMILVWRQQSTLRTAARLDHLTGLANRRALEEA